LAKNFKRKWGEVDIIGKEKGKIVFFEVKTVIKNRDFLPEDKINPKKKRQLLKMVQIYLSENKINQEVSCQIDILAIEVSPDFKKTKIRHYKNAIENNY
jgi:putative endonuclease